MREMKESHIPFCENIPINWSEIPNKYIFSCHSTKVGDKSSEYQLLSLTTSGVKEKSTTASGGKVPTSYDGYQTVEIGDMIFCLFDLDCSAVFSGLSPYNGMITSAYDVLRANPNRADNHFLEYWFQYVFSNRYYKMFSKNIRYTVTGEMFNSIYTPIPPIEEQKKIGSYLDKLCKKVDALIANQEAQIEKLKAYKQSLITEVVTKGIDPNVPMKDSGVEWIGLIPKHWNTIATKYLFRIESGATPKSENPEYFDGDIPWITPADYKTEEVFVFGGRRNISELGLKSCSTTLIPKGSLIFSKRAPIGAVAINAEELCTNQGCLSCIPKTEDIVKYYYYVMSVCTEQYNLLGSGTTFKEISATNFANFVLPNPSVSEQEEMVAYLDEKCSKVDRLIAIKNAKIEKLSQYKKSLIYEYVTGKKEVI